MEQLDHIPNGRDQWTSVHVHMTVTQMVMAYQQKYGNDAFTVSRDFAFSWGNGLGKKIKERDNIQGTDASAVAELLNACLEEVGLWNTKLSRFVVKGNKAIANNYGLCAFMSGTKIDQVVKVPHETICPNYSWRVLEGIAAAANPDVMHEIPESRAFGNNRCQHIFIVP